jgi:hypothetical protein
MLLRSTITLQQLIDSGLNGFAVQLLAESINGHHQKERLRRPFLFAFDDVVFTLSLMPERDWTKQQLLEIFETIAALEEPDSYLRAFAHAYVVADKTERLYLTHVALLLIEEYGLWACRSTINDTQTEG